MVRQESLAQTSVVMKLNSEETTVLNTADMQPININISMNLTKFESNYFQSI